MIEHRQAELEPNQNLKLFFPHNPPNVEVSFLFSAWAHSKSEHLFSCDI